MTAYFIFFLVNAALFLIYNSGQPASIWLHYAISPFIYGVSKFKINFFLLYFCLLAALTVIPFNLRSEKIISRLRRTIFFVIFTALLANALSFFLFIRQFSLPLDRYAYHFKGQYHSINYFAHIHTGKAVIAKLLDLLNLGSLNNYYDTGLVFAAYIPSWITVVLALSVVSSFVLSLLLLDPVIRPWPRGRAFIVFVIYAFASAHVLKCLVDGGLFSYDLFPSLIALHLLLISRDPHSLINNFKRLRNYYFLAAVLYLGACSLISFNEGVLQVPFGFAFVSSFYMLLFIPILVEAPKSAKVILTWLLFLLFVVFYWSMHGLSAIQAMSAKLGKGDRVLVFNYPNRSGLPVITEQTDKMAGKTILEAYRELGENPLRNRRVAIIKAGEGRFTGFIFVLKIIKSKEDIKLDSNALMRIDEIRPFPQYGKKAYQMRVSLNPYLFPSLWSNKLTVLEENNKYCVLFFLNHYFLQKGISEYAIIPYYFFDVDRSK